MKDLLYKKQINNLQERTSEMRRHINGASNVLKNMENDLLELLSLASDTIVNDNTALNNKINEWWNMNIEYCENENKITSTEFWNKFKRENKEYVLENKVTIDQFKDSITNIVDSSTYTEKTKKGVIEFNCFKFKEIVIENIIIENLELKKNKREKKIQYYFDKNNDEKMLEEYEEVSNNIMTISEANKIRPWEVVSLLMRYKKIKKRDEARGYDIYKQTDEYINKINK